MKTLSVFFFYFFANFNLAHATVFEEDPVITATPGLLSQKTGYDCSFSRKDDGTINAKLFSTGDPIDGGILKFELRINCLSSSALDNINYRLIGFWDVKRGGLTLESLVSMTPSNNSANQATMLGGFELYSNQNETLNGRISEALNLNSSKFRIIEAYVDSNFAVNALVEVPNPENLTDEQKKMLCSQYCLAIYNVSTGVFKKYEPEDYLD